MKKLLVFLIITVLMLGVFAACSDKAEETASVETTASAPLTQAPEVVTEEKTVAPELTAVQESPTTIKTEESRKDVEENKTEASRPDPTKAVNTGVRISRKEAKEIVLAYAGLSENDIKFYESELDREENGFEYEIEFHAGEYEYEYKVDAESGEVLEAEKELRD